MNEQKGFIIPLITLLIFIAMVGGGFYVYKTGMIRGITSSSSSVQTPLPSIDTSSWKVYTNRKYGFEMSYPADLGITFYVVKPTREKNATVTEQVETINWPNQHVGDNKGPMFLVSYVDSSLPEEKLVEYRSRQNFSASNIYGEMRYVSMGGIKSIKFRSNSPQNSAWRLNFQTGRLLDNQIDQNDVLLKQIISTVKFFKAVSP
jgi:hypothetical protein